MQEWPPDPGDNAGVADTNKRERPRDKFWLNQARGIPVERTASSLSPRVCETWNPCCEGSDIKAPNRARVLRASGIRTPPRGRHRSTRLTSKIVRVVVRVEAVLDVVVHLVVGPHSALVPVGVHSVVHTCRAHRDNTRCHECFGRGYEWGTSFA